MARHITNLQDQLQQLRAEKDSVSETIFELKIYLQSDKFNCGDDLDGYVNINDVLNRLKGL